MTQEVRPPNWTAGGSRVGNRKKLKEKRVLDSRCVLDWVGGWVGGESGGSTEESVALTPRHLGS